jgi:hypothetical protein
MISNNMIIEPPKTVKDFIEVRNSILKLMDNPWIDGSMYSSLTMKLTKVNDKIEDLKAERK